MAYTFQIVMILALVAVVFGKERELTVSKSITDFATMLKDRVQGFMEGEGDTSSIQWPPAFCNKLDCPKYSVVKTKAEYEVRKYEASNWVSTGITGIDYDRATSTLFMRLFNYISGDNVRKEKINMTAPVLERIIPGQGPACKNDFRMSFFISPKVSGAPKPSNVNVTLSSLPAQTVYVSTYPGFNSKDKMIAHAADLVAALEKDQVSYSTGYYYYAGYDSPFKLFHRHNEIWVVGK